MDDRTPTPTLSSPPSPSPTPTPPQPSNKAHSNDDKQSEAGAGGITSQEFRQNHSQAQPPRPPMPNELTAEWTVRAQLRFARAGETVRKDFCTNDPVNPVRVVYKWSTLDADATVPEAEGEENGGRPAEDDKYHSEVYKRNSSRSSGYSQDPTKAKSRKGCQTQESFRSTTSSTTCFGGADSAFSGSNTSHKPKTDSAKAAANGNDPEAAASFYGTRCRSTCNIIVSAVADFLPSPGRGHVHEGDSEMGPSMNFNYIPEEEPDPFVFNTTACYTVLPEKSFDEDSCPQTPKSKTYSTTGKMLNLRDAVCQTSDTETKYFEEFEHKRYKQSHSLDRRDSRRAYDCRRATAEALLQPPNHGSVVNEGNSFKPSYMTSTSPAFKSASMPRIPSAEGEDGPPQPLGSLPAFMASNKTVQSAGDPQKKPRTVHIDVYCTGSEDEDHADAESSSESDDNRRHDQESNSTFQTVLDNEQMRLRHQRITGGTLPRRLATPAAASQMPTAELPAEGAHLESAELQLGHGITKSSTADEVNESKQLLFRKHIGDQRAIKLHNLRQKYLRQSSDDALSLGYPSSTRSTVRDNTCSSVSSVLAGHDVIDSPWKETDDAEDYSLTKSDSFEYENAMDRLRIRQMERLWSRSHSKEDDPNIQALPHHMQPQQQQHLQSAGHLQTISEVNTPQRISPFTSRLQRDDTLPSESELNSEGDQFYPYANQAQSMRTTSPVTTTATRPYFHQTSHVARSRPGFLQFFGPQNEGHSQQPMSAPVQGATEPSLLYPNYHPGLQRWKSETRDNLSASGTPALTPTELSRHSSPQPPGTPVFQRSGSEAPPNTTSATTFPTTTPTPARRFDMFQTYRESPSASDASTLPPTGYSSEYLDKARKFGKVVTARKPGHHVGPTKNPNCSCESCQRWLAERFQIRGRAFSLGDSAILRRAK